MQPPSQKAGQRNNNPEYQNDDPKRGGNITSNKSNSLRNKEQSVVSQPASTSEGNDHRGARSHVINHPAKANHPG
jgi:hypothetical protein